MHTHGLRSLPTGSKAFENIHRDVKERAEMALPDITLPLRDLRYTDLHTVAVPGMGHFQLTSWSRQQLASLLGIRWGKWFEESSPREVAEEVNRRFERSTHEKKLRMMRDDSTFSDGILRAFVGPKFSPIDDDRVFGCLAKSGDLEEVGFVRSSTTDRSSQFAGVLAEPINMATDEEPDWIYPGFLLRNSEVGYTSLTLDVFTYRLVCTNGLLVMVGGERLLYRQHRPIEPERLSGMLETAFSKMRGSMALAVERLSDSRGETIEDPQEVIRGLVRASALPSSAGELAMEAYLRDPNPTRYGIVQSLTEAAKELSPEQRFDVEQLAGRYLMAA